MRTPDSHIMLVLNETFNLRNPIWAVGGVIYLLILLIFMRLHMPI